MHASVVSNIDREPERNVVKLSDIPQQPDTQLPKGYWDCIIHHLELLAFDEALALKFEVITGRVTSSVHCAAARAGYKVGTKVVGKTVYVWLAGKCEVTRRHPPRPPIQCAVCGELIERPKTGGSKQFVCSGNKRRKSRCQMIRRRARQKGITPGEYIQKYARKKSLHER